MRCSVHPVELCPSKPIPLLAPDLPPPGCLLADRPTGFVPQPPPFLGLGLALLEPPLLQIELLLPKLEAGVFEQLFTAAVAAAGQGVAQTTAQALAALVAVLAAGAALDTRGATVLHTLKQLLQDQQQEHEPDYCGGYDDVVPVGRKQARHHDLETSDGGPDWSPDLWL